MFGMYTAFTPILLYHALNYRLGEAMSIVSDSKTWCNTKDGRLLAKFVFKYQPLGQCSPSYPFTLIDSAKILLELLIAEGIAPANLYKRKDYDEDSDAEDEAQLNSVNVSFFNPTLMLTDYQNSRTPLPCSRRSLQRGAACLFEPSMWIRLLTTKRMKILI